MKILIGNDNFGAHFYDRLGLARAFISCDHQTSIWQIGEKPVNDVFDEFEPDIFIFQTYNLTRSIINAIQERPHLRTIMKAAEWSLFSDSIPESYQVLKATNVEIENVFKLRDSGHLDYLYIYYHPDYIKQTHQRWFENGIPVKCHMEAADIFDYTGGVERPEFKSDIVFLGGYWPYKAKVLEKYLIPICRESKYNIKIFGNSIWPVHQYCGSAPALLVKDILASATICPNLHEPHSQDFGYDMNERTFKLLANKCFVISDYVEGLNKIFNENELILTKTPKEFKDSIEYYIKYPDDRIKHIDRGYKKVIQEHTYFDRVIEIFNNLNLKEEAEQCKKKKEYILNQMKL